MGSLHTATVRSVQTYGAFCTLEGYDKDGLLHVSQLHPTGGRVASVESVVAVGDRVRVRVLSVDMAAGKVALTASGVRQGADAPATLQKLQTASPPSAAALGKPPTASQLERLDCVSFSYSRASGAGGQNVNKVSTRCEARLRLDESPWPEAVRGRLKPRATAGGDVLVASERHRTQAANRRDALEKLAELVAEAWRPPKQREMRTAPSARAKRERRQDKARQSEKKSARREGKRGSFDARRLEEGLGGLATWLDPAWAVWWTASAHMPRNV